MRVRNEERHDSRKLELMERSYACFAEHGLGGVGMRSLAAYCGCSVAVFYHYFKDLDDMIVQSTAYCMSKVEDDFMALAPTNVEELWQFVRDIPYWTAEKHGKKYRLMYQVYTHPKYREYGKRFFEGVNLRYTAYAKSLESKLGIPYDVITPLIFILIRACVHYALFEDEFYLKAQLRVLEGSIQLYMEKYRSETGGKRE